MSVPSSLRPGDQEFSLIPTAYSKVLRNLHFAPPSSLGTGTTDTLPSDLDELTEELRNAEGAFAKALADRDAEALLQMSPE